jgi:hypothetical protein
MNLVSTVTVTVPGYTRRHDHAVVPPREVTGDKLGITIIDDVVRRAAQARLAFVRPGLGGSFQPFLPFRNHVELWTGDAYDEAGDYTQADVEARVLELLGEDVQAGLQALLERP